MLSFKRIKMLLGDRNLKEISKRSGVPYGSVVNIKKSKTGGNLKLKNIELLSNYFESQAEKKELT